MAKNPHVTTEDDDRKFRQALKNLDLIDNSYVTVGVHQKEGTKQHVGITGKRSKATTAEVAFWNEFGTRKAPARPFMRSTMDENRKKFRAEINRLHAKAMIGEISVEHALDKSAFRIYTAMQERIQTSPSWAKPNKPSVQKAKARGGAVRNIPLIVTTLLYRSLTYRINLRGRNKE